MNVFRRHLSFPSGSSLLAAWCFLARAMPGRAFDRGMYDQGTSAYLQATFHGLDRLAFLELQHTLLLRIAQTAVGAGDSIVFRDMDTSQRNGDLGYEARLLFDFSPADATPASLVASMLSKNPEAVLPTDVFGSFSVSHATVLQCPMPCGEHGLRAPEIAAGSSTVSCTCQCDPGWETDLNQPFETFVYCSVGAGNTIDGPLTTPSTPSTPTTSTTAPISSHHDKQQHRLEATGAELPTTTSRQQDDQKVGPDFQMGHHWRIYHRHCHPRLCSLPHQVLRSVGNLLRRRMLHQPFQIIQVPGGPPTHPRARHAPTSAGAVRLYDSRTTDATSTRLPDAIFCFSAARVLPHTTPASSARHGAARSRFPPTPRVNK